MTAFEVVAHLCIGVVVGSFVYYAVDLIRDRRAQREI